MEIVAALAAMPPRIKLAKKLARATAKVHPSNPASPATAATRLNPSEPVSTTA
jgi:hypothetical protein